MNRPFMFQPILLLLLCLSFGARAQTPYVGGPPAVCAGSQYVYNVTYPTPGLIYFFTVSSHGNIALVAGNTATVYWGLDGSALVTATGKNSLGATIETLTLPVTVHALPTPLIDIGTPIACQPLKYYPPDQVPEFDTSECQVACAHNGTSYHALMPFSSSVVWTVNGGNNSTPTAKNITVLWGAPGQGTVTVTETSAAGCMGSKTICIDKIEGPAAHFVAMPDTALRHIHICEGSTVQFIDKSQASGGSPIVSWFWDFGDGTYSSAPGGTLTPVSHTYPTPGHYTVQLQVTNACGCTSYETMEIDVDHGTGVQISCPGVVCDQATASYTATPACNPLSWSVVGGTLMTPTASTVTVQWTNPPDGFGYLVYDPSSCAGTCPSATVVKVPVVDAAHPIEGEVVICPDGEYLYKLPQWPSTLFNWSFVSPPGTTLEATDQPNEIVIKTGSSGGSIMLRCDYENTLLGCTGQTVLNINVLNPETITGDKKVCLNTASSNYTLAGGNSGNWTFYDPYEVVVATGSGAAFAAGPFDQVGLYRLEVTGTGYCDPKPMFITVDPLPPTPTDITGPDTICKGVPVQFAGMPELGGSVLRWAMQNGTVNPEQGPFSFIKLNTTSNGPFVVYLWRESKELPYCHSDTIRQTIDTPFIDPVVSGDTTPCMDSYFPYTVDYTDGESYHWRIEPEYMGSVEIGQNSPNITVLWNHQPDTAWVICEVRKCYGVFIDSLLVDISPPIQFNATVVPGVPCTGELTGFAIGSSTIASSTWNFGDGTPPVTFSGNGSSHAWDNVYGAKDSVLYMVTYNAVNLSGCPNGIVNGGPYPVWVRTAPWTNIVPASVPCKPSLGFTETLTADSNTANPHPKWFDWYRNGVKVYSGPDNFYNATDFGEYYVIAFKDSANGQGINCYDTSTNKVRIKQCGQSGCGLTPLPFVSIDSLWDSCGYVHVDASHTSPNWIISNWQITDVHGVKTSSTTATTADFWFKKAGVYTITYSASYSDGLILCQVDDQVTVTIPYVPDIDFTAFCTESAGQRKVRFDFNGTLLAPAFWQYSINSGGFSLGSPYEAHLLPGNHNIGIQVTIPGYPVCTYYEQVTIPDLPQANFVTDRPITCEKEAPVVFTNTSTDAATAFWDFNDFAQNTQYHPERVFDDNRIYNVMLAVEDSFGCKDTIWKDVTIVQDSINGETIHSPTNPCEGTPVTLNYSPFIQVA